MKNLLNLLTACVLCLGFAVNARAQGRILSVEELNNCPTGTKIALKALSAYDKRLCRPKKVLQDLIQK